MINNWMIPRNKRKLYPVVDVLSIFVLQNMGGVWGSDLTRQLYFESMLERYGLKRPGKRRDRRAGGARTYEAWLFNLGLIFIETETNIVRTTLAGEALLAGQSPVPIITNQLLKLQYPSPYSIRSRVRINKRFRIRPFRFLLRLLADPRVKTLTKSEIGRFVITEAENETSMCFELVVRRILDYRNYGDDVLAIDFEKKYQSSTTGVRTRESTLSYLEDIANTFINYLEYTQLISRNASGEIYIPPEREVQVNNILSDGTSIRSFNQNHEFGEENFQRNFGLAPDQSRDNRTFGGGTVTDVLYRQRSVRNELLHISRKRPLVSIDTSLINEISSLTGYSESQVEESLSDFRPDTFSVFEASYLNMAIGGRELARDFEVATSSIFEIMGFKSTHVGANSLHPDVFVESILNYTGIIDTKAYRTYSISNDHRNRMVSNYIPTYQRQNGNLEFFMYVAEGFGTNIDSQIQQIFRRTNVRGSVISARNLIRLLQRQLISPIDHQDYRTLFTVNRKISIQDIDSL